jgi:hypothetical protein
MGRFTLIHVLERVIRKTGFIGFRPGEMRCPWNCGDLYGVG